MIKNFLNQARSGEPVYISDVCETFNQLKGAEQLLLYCVLDLLADNEKRLFKISLPGLDQDSDEEKDFIKTYLYAQLYNILSALGGKSMTIYLDQCNRDLVELAAGLNEVFSINKSRSKRSGYGRSVNVIDRMLSAVCPGEKGFCFAIKDISLLPAVTDQPALARDDSNFFKNVTQNLGPKTLLGIDVGGTDIKAVAVKNGSICCYKEYDWFPTLFKYSKQLVDPICLIVRLLQVKISCDHCPDEQKITAQLKADIERALHKDAADEFMTQVVARAESVLGEHLMLLDGIGLCFPDVVVQNKVVGGEVYKTRGIRNNQAIDYETDFKVLTDLNTSLQKYTCHKNGVKIINDGPMAAFTAAVEIAASNHSQEIKNGVFAHTLGTELGTGWIKSNGNIPDIPLEVYNFIIDLGSFIEKQYEPDDLRSINNFNTQLAGTLQKYCSQSGVFRLALKYWPGKREDLYQELFKRGFVVEQEKNGLKGFYVPTKPVDMRKPFLEYMMEICEKENDEINAKIWRDLGEYLAVTWLETQKILNPEAKERFLFGRLVKRKKCFDLMCQGAQKIKPDLKFVAAGTDMAHSPLMKQLEKEPHYTVAQFAQAVGAVYFANSL